MSRNTDYEPILRKIRENLHDHRGSRAAVMVGAGFSRNAVPLQSTRMRMPSWNDLVVELKRCLYGDDKGALDSDSSSGTSVALRLAQEFETAQGRPALIQLVRKIIRDEAFSPGALHRQLLELPWVDVFTTNYDCLLEEASRSVRRQTYDVVRGIADIPVARRPRIVKLHGTLPELENMVLTEDDFRSYPSRREPFVNLVQTSLAENSFCLLGFSGDDPNFLNWTGWVRDKLGDSTPFIFFFRYSEVPLLAFQRRLLESRRIVPIDLNELYPGCNVVEAHKELLQRLAEKPGPPRPSWDDVRRYRNQRVDSSTATEPRCSSGCNTNEWKAAIRTWREHRTRYQGWVVLPRPALQRLKGDVVSWMNACTKQKMDGLSIVDRLVLVRELTWRAATASFPLFQDFVVKVVDPLLYDVQCSVNIPDIQGQLMSWEMDSNDYAAAINYIRRQILRHAREVGDESRFNTLREKCEEDFGKTDGIDDDRHFVTHQVVLLELGRLNHLAAREALLSWKTHGASAIWKVRRGALLLECSEVEAGINSLEEAFRQIRSAPISPTEYELLTTEGCLLTVILCLLQSNAANNNPLVHVKLPPYSIVDSETDSTHRATQSVVGSGIVDDTEPDASTADAALRLPDERAAIERLEALTRLNCDPHATLEWFQDVLEYRPKKQSGTYEVENFEIGRVAYTTVWGDNPPLQRAYQAIRFIEDAAIPLTVSRTIPVEVAANVFSNAAILIAESSATDHVRLVLRSRSSKLIREFLSRGRVGRCSEAQVSFLLVSAINSLRSVLSKIGPPLPERTDSDSFWERNLEIACILLDRVSARLTQDQLCGLIGQILPLSWDQRLMGRVNGYDDLINAIWRCCSLLTSESAGSLLEAFLQSPVLGADALPVSAVRVGNWIDPVAAVEAAVPPLEAQRVKEISQRVEDLFARSLRAGTVERRNIIARLFALKRQHLLSDNDQIRLFNLLFEEVDENGMPSGIDILPTYAALSLPSRSGLNERRLFRHGVVDQCDGDIWRTLAFSVSRFGRPREDPQRSIKWTKGDLRAILRRATEWITTTQNSTPGTTHTLAASMRAGEADLRKKHYRAWLQVVEEVVLLAPNRDEAIVDDCWNAIEIAKSQGFHTLKAWPTLIQLQRINVEETVREIRRGLCDNEDELVWQACCAIVRWAELERKKYLIPLPSVCLQTLGTLLMDSRQAMLPLLLNTSRDLVGIYRQELSVGFQSDLFHGLKKLLLETEYFGGESRRWVNQRIQLRQISLKLVHALREIGIQHPVADEWIESARKDVFEDVRRLA